MSNKFKKYFAKSLINEAAPATSDIPSDAEALDKSIENPIDKQRLDHELQNVAVGADAVNADISKLRETASQYSNELMSILDRIVKIHDDITTGSLAKLGIKLSSNTLTSIRGDLGKLAQIIGGGANDVIIKNETEKAKEAKTPVV
jgi:hypothetical protein